MAYFNNPDDEENNVTSTPAGGTDTSVNKPSSSTINTNAASSSAAPKTTSTNTAAPQQRKFANLYDYINANKTQTAGLANQVAGTVSGAGNDARSALNTGVANYNTDVDKNTINVNQDVFNRAKTDPTSLVGNISNPSAVRPNSTNYLNTTGFSQNNSKIVRPSTPATNYPQINTNSIFSPNFDPAAGKGVNNLNDLKTFINMRDAQYNGPTSLQSSQYFQPIQDKFNTAQQTTQNAGTEAGTGQLVGDIQKKQNGGNINKSANLLDTGLLRGDSNAQGIIGKSIAGNANLDKSLTGAETGSVNRATAAGATTDKTRNTIQNAFTGDNSPQAQLEKQLTDKANADISASNDKSNAIQQILSSGQDPSPDQLQALGMSPEQWGQLQNSIRNWNIQNDNQTPFDLSKYLTINDPSAQINAQNDASSADYAKYKALNTLMGTNNSFLSDPSQAGTANTNAVSFDSGAAQGDVDQAYNDSVAAQNATSSSPAKIEKLKEDVRNQALHKAGPLAKIFKHLKIF